MKEQVNGKNYEMGLVEAWKMHEIDKINDSNDMASVYTYLDQVATALCSD